MLFIQAKCPSTTYKVYEAIEGMLACVSSKSPCFEFWDHQQANCRLIPGKAQVSRCTDYSEAGYGSTFCSSSHSLLSLITKNCSVSDEDEWDRVSGSYFDTCFFSKSFLCFRPQPLLRLPLGSQMLLEMRLVTPLRSSFTGCLNMSAYLEKGGKTHTHTSNWNTWAKTKTLLHLF